MRSSEFPTSTVKCRAHSLSQNPRWGCKICLLLLYWQITQNLRQHILVKIVLAYVVVTYVVMQILYFGVWCQPFRDYWQVPTRNLQCSATINHLITNLSFNLSSDIMILGIPIPLLLKQHLEWRRKLLMVLPFTFGFLTIACAIMSKYASFHAPYSAEWVYWYCREASTTMIVSNMPYVWGLIRKLFNLRSLISEGGDDLRPQNVELLQGRRVSSSQTQTSVLSSSSSTRHWFGTKSPIQMNETAAHSNC